MKKIFTTVLVLAVCMMQVFALSTVMTFKAGPAWETTGLLRDGSVITGGSGASYMDVNAYVDVDMFFGYEEKYGLRLGLEAISFPVMATENDVKQDVDWKDFSYLRGFSAGMTFKGTEGEHGDLLLSIGLGVDWDTVEKAGVFDRTAVSIGLAGEIDYNWKCAEHFGLSVGCKIGAPLVTWQKIDSSSADVKAREEWVMPGSTVFTPFVGFSATF